MNSIITKILEQNEEHGNLALIIIDDQTNRPISEALVVISDENFNDIIAADTSNVQGLACFQNLAAGRYKIRVNTDGFKLINANVVVEAGKLNIDDIQLQSEIIDLEVY